MVYSQNYHAQVSDIGKVVRPLMCHMTGGNQYWMFRRSGVMSHGLVWIGVDGPDGTVSYWFTGTGRFSGTSSAWVVRLGLTTTIIKSMSRGSLINPNIEKNFITPKQYDINTS